MEADDGSLRVMPNALDSENRHICAFLQRYGRALPRASVIHERGLRHGGQERSILVDPARREDHLRRLSDAGIDVEESMTSGQLEVHPWEDGPLHGGALRPGHVGLRGFEQVLSSGHASGYANTRFLAQMEWALVDMPGIDDMIEFDAPRQLRRSRSTATR